MGWGGGGKGGEKGLRYKVFLCLCLWLGPCLSDMMTNSKQGKERE